MDLAWDALRIKLNKDEPRKKKEGTVSTNNITMDIAYQKIEPWSRSQTGVVTMLESHGITVLGC